MERLRRTPALKRIRSQLGRIDSRYLRYAAVFSALGITSLGAYSLTSAETPTVYTFVGAGDIAMTLSKAEQTAKVLDTIVAGDPNTTVWTAGDNVYENGTDSEFASLYAPTWGRHRDRTMPTPGNHEYQTSGATGYYKYFCPTADNCVFPGDTQRKYYSYDLGNWHIVALNSEVEYQAGSAQLQWLQQDLAANPGKCLAAIWHKPYFNGGISHGRELTMRPFWDVLYAAKADVILNGHEHVYERFGKQTPDGVAAADGIRQFTVGTGGASFNSFGTILPNSQARNSSVEGVLKLMLTDGGYQWQFMPVAGKVYNESGTETCNNTTGDAFPSVTVTAPASNTTVKGTDVAVTANASDDTGIAGVQFNVDGIAAGAEITAAPYAFSWDTTAVSEGQHTLTAVARDNTGKTTTSQPVTVTVDNVLDTTVTIEKQPATSADDAEQASNGSVVLDSTDLELVTDASVQTVGMRFNGITVPKGAVIKDAYLQFTVDEASSDTTSLTIRGESNNSAAAFTATSNNVSSRPKTTAAVTWSPVPWTVLNEAGPAQRTPGLAPVISEITSRPGWTSGNSLAIIVNGSGRRNAHAWDGSASQAPKLHIEYEIDRTAPAVPAGLTASVQSATQVNLAWTASADDTAVAGYKLYRNGVQVGTASGTTYNDSGLSPDTTYTYTVEAFDTSNNLSGQSGGITATTPPAPVTETFTFRPSADATVKSKSNKSNFGTATTLETDNSPVIDFLMKFDVTGLAGKRVVSAKLSVYNTDPSAVGGRFFRTANTAWTENAVNWNNAPAADATPFGTLGAVAANRWYDVDALPVVNGDGSYSFRVKSTSSDGAVYRSKEAGSSTAAQLVIVTERL